jgi:hypothetical protein
MDELAKYYLSEAGMQISNWKVEQAKADLEALKWAMEEREKNPMPASLVDYFISKGINPFTL